MQLYVMNLKRAENRMTLLRERFGAAGLEVTRVEGVDGGLLDQSELDRHISGEGRWGRLTPGEVGCFLSHRACWRALLEDGGRFGAVFEDDVLLGENAGAVLGDTAWIPEDADIVKLETTASRVFLDAAARGSVDGRALHRLRSSHYCAAGYIVSHDCAQRLLAQSDTFCEALDDFLFSGLSPVFKSSRIYQLSPAICVQQWETTGDGRTHDPHTSIEGRDDKVKRRLPPGERLREVWGKESRTLANKFMALVGKRRRQIVEFR